MNILISIDDYKERPDIRLVFTDMDGTLSHEGIIPEENVSALKGFLEDNFMNHVVLASARPEYSLISVLEKNGMDRLVDSEISLCSFNGHLSTYKGFTLTDMHLPADILSSVARRPAGSGELVLFHSQDISYGNLSQAWKAWEKEKLQYEFRPTPKHFEKTKVYLVEIMKTTGQGLDGLMNAFSGRSDITTYSFNSLFANLPEPVSRLVHIMPSSMNKGLALARYIEASGVDPKNILVLGDSINDYESLTYPGINAVLIGKPEDAFRKKFEESQSRIYVAGNSQTGFAYALGRFAR